MNKMLASITDASILFTRSNNSLEYPKSIYKFMLIFDFSFRYLRIRDTEYKHND